MFSGLTQETKVVLNSLGISPRRRLGQNFMVSEHELRFIRDSVSAKEGDTVLEIGPGLGFLTRTLLEKGAEVVAVEKDRLLASRLRERFKDKPLTVIEKDILELRIEKDLGVKKPIWVAGNIPYNITSPILEWLISQRHLVSEAVLTVQWEVALRLSAQPGTKSWGPLSVFVQVYSKVSVLKKISKAAFFPSPKVDSAVVKLVFPEVPLFPIADEEKFFSVVRRSFQKRRKTILNSLVDTKVPKFSKESIAETLQKAGINPLRRPETLTIPEWIALVDAL